MTNPRTRQLIAITMALIMLLSAGCTGWGDDGPAEPEPEQNGSDDVENASDNSNTDESDERESPSDDNTGDSSDTNDESGDDSNSDDDSNDESSNDNDNDSPPENGENGDDDDEERNEDNDDDGDDNNNESPSENGDGSDDTETYTLTVQVQKDVPVTITRLSDGATTERTASDGTVEFEVSEDRYAVSAESHYNINEDMAYEVSEDTSFELQSTEGQPIDLNVVDAETGESIEGAEISGVCDWWHSGGDDPVAGETGSDGTANVDVPHTPTSCDTNFDAEGYESTTDSVSIPEDDGMTVELAPEQPESHEVTVNIVYPDDAPETPTLNMGVGDEGQFQPTPVDDGDTITLEEGTYEFAADIYEDSEYSAYSVIDDPGTVELDSNQEITFEVGYDPTLYEATVIVQGSDGDRISGADVDIEGVTDGSVMTDANGVLTTEAPPGMYTVTASNVNHQDGTEQLEVTDSGGSETLTLEPAIRDASVVVTDENGQAVPGAEVTIGGTTETADDSGTATFELEQGAYEMTVTADGMSTESDEFHITPNGNDREVTLQSSADDGQTQSRLTRPAA